MNKEREIINETMECLYNSIKSKDKIINEQVLEIAHLNLQLDQALKDYEKELTKIDKAIEYIKEHSYNSYFSMLQADYNMSLDELLEILGDKEWQKKN